MSTPKPNSSYRAERRNGRRKLGGLSRKQKPVVHRSEARDPPPAAMRYPQSQEAARRVRQRHKVLSQLPA